MRDLEAFSRWVREYGGEHSELSKALWLYAAHLEEQKASRAIRDAKRREKKARDLRVNTEPGHHTVPQQVALAEVGRILLRGYCRVKAAETTGQERQKYLNAMDVMQ